MTNWTESAVATLRQMWVEGLSASLIARQLGNGISRNAVIGKAVRLGLRGSKRSPEVGQEALPHPNAGNGVNLVSEGKQPSADAVSKKRTSRNQRRKRARDRAATQSNAPKPGDARPKHPATESAKPEKHQPQLTKRKQKELNNTIWQACDTFRGAVDATRYKDLILAVLFWKYLSDTSEARKEELLRQYGPQDPRIERQMKRARFILPEGTDFWTIYKSRHVDNLGEEINKALDAIERENDPKLKDLFRPIDFNSESLLGATRERNRLIR
jgi:hypothetical protein